MFLRDDGASVSSAGHLHCLLYVSNYSNVSLCYFWFLWHFTCVDRLVNTSVSYETYVLTYLHLRYITFQSQCCILFYFIRFVEKLTRIMINYYTILWPVSMQQKHHPFLVFVPVSDSSSLQAVSAWLFVFLIFSCFELFVRKQVPHVSISNFFVILTSSCFPVCRSWNEGSLYSPQMVKGSSSVLSTHNTKPSQPRCLYSAFFSFLLFSYPPPCLFQPSFSCFIFPYAFFIFHSSLPASCLLVTVIVCFLSFFSSLIPIPLSSTSCSLQFASHSLSPLTLIFANLSSIS